MAGNKLIFKNAEEVRNAIMASQKKEIAKLYEDWADEIGERAKYYSHKSTASAPVSERYYRELQKQLRATSQEVSNEVYKKIRKNIYTVADAVVSDNIKWLESFGFSSAGLNAAFSYVPDEIVRNLVTGQIYDSGWSLSSRIWSDNEQTLKDIYQVMAKGLAENKPVYEIAKDLESYVRPGAKLPWNLQMSDGKKIYKKQVDYNAQRLARTLVQHGYQQSFIATTQKNPFVTEYIWHSNGSRVCPLCMERDGMVFQKDDLPMDHPNGMCTMEPVVADDMVDQLADWFNSPDGTYPEIDKFAKDFGYKTEITIDMNSLTNNLTEYVGGGYLSVKDAVTPEEFEYIQSKMKLSSNSFYRIEEMKFTVEAKDLQKGSTFTFTDNLRSFTSEFDDIEKFIRQAEDWGGYKSPVVFQTIGDVKTFDMSPYTKEYIKLMGDQHEHLIGGKMKVIDFEYKFINDVKVLFVKIEQIPKPSVQKFDSVVWYETMRKQNLETMESWCDDWLKVISSEERNGIRFYTGLAYADINKYLRGQISSTSYADEIKQVTAALKKASLPEEVIVKRGSDYNMLKELGIDISEASKDKVIGALVTDKGFMSTSAASDESFDGDIEYIIKIPKGSQAMYIDTISKYRGEKEILINRGGKYIIEDVEFDSYGNVKKIYMTLKNLKGLK